MYKENMAYISNGILCSLKKEGNPFISYSMGDTRGHYTKQKANHKKTAMCDYTHITKVAKVIETEVNK